MLALSVSASFPTKTPTAQSFYSRRLCHPSLSLSPPLKCHQQKPLRPSAFLGFNPLRASVNCKGMVMNKKRNAFGAVCYAGPLTATNLQWVATVSSVILMLARGTAIHKSFLVPLFALQAPASIVSWIKGEYGIWTAFLALLVRLFFFFPGIELPVLAGVVVDGFCWALIYGVSAKGELELPLVALLLVIVAPYQVMNLRAKPEGVIVSLIIAAYLAYQHYTRAGGLRKAFDQGYIVASVAIICIVAVPCLLLI